MANEILARAKAHYEKKAGDCRLEVEEWGDGKKPLVITWTPLTVHQRRRIYEDKADGRPADGSTIMVRAVLMKACDENGNRLFDDMAEKELTHDVDSDVVGKIGNAIIFGAGVKPAAVKDQVTAAKNG